MEEDGASTSDSALAEPEPAALRFCAAIAGSGPVGVAQARARRRARATRPAGARAGTGGRVICETPPALDGAEADRLRETPRDGHRRVDRAPGGTSRGTGVSAETAPAGAPETDELAKAGFRAQSGVLGAPGYPGHVDDGVRAARITDAVLGSATSGGWVDV